MPWTAPVTAVANNDYTFTQYNKDADNLRWVVRPLLVLGELDITNTALETDWLGDANGVSPVITGNAMGTGGMLRLIFSGSLQNSAVSHLAGDFALSWGGSVVWSDHFEPFDNHALVHTVRLKVYICNLGATNSQFVVGFIAIGSAANAPATGTGRLADVTTNAQGPFIVPFGCSAKTTVDTTVDQTLKFTVTSQAYPDIHMYRGGATIELVGQSA